jgi:hypothetical protein
MREQLEFLADSPHEWARERALAALAIADAHATGEVNDEEFMELMQDLVRTDQLDLAATDLETKALLITAVLTVARVI